MYRIFLLHEMQGEYCRTKDYLQLSGCEVMEGELCQVPRYEESIQEMDLVLLSCDYAETGFEVCEKVREMTQVPIIVLSKNNDEWAKIKMFQSGADDYLVEPFSQGELMARIKAHILRYKRLTRPFGYIQVRGLEIETISRRVLLDGKEVSMTLKEFDVLLYLAQCPNRVITKKELYGAVWKDELGEGYYNSVAVHVKRIRKKIEEDPENPKYIETVWGVGYRFRM